MGISERNYEKRYFFFSLLTGGVSGRNYEKRFIISFIFNGWGFRTKLRKSFFLIQFFNLVLVYPPCQGSRKWVLYDSGVSSFFPSRVHPCLKPIGFTFFFFFFAKVTRATVDSNGEDCATSWTEKKKWSVRRSSLVHISGCLFEQFIDLNRKQRRIYYVYGYFWHPFGLRQHSNGKSSFMVRAPRGREGGGGVSSNN